MRHELYAAARMYYEEERSQQEVAEALGVSRSTVSRLLTEARRRGIVRIEVLPPPEPEELASELVAALGLQAVFLTLPTANGEPPWSGLAAKTADALAGSGLAGGDVLLVGWGRTIWELVRHPLCSLAGVVVAPMVGGLDEPSPWFHTNEMVRRLARRIGGEVSPLHAPGQPSPALRRELERDPSTLQTLRLWDRADAALVGIGAPPAVLDGYGPAHLPRDQGALRGAAGDIASRYFDLEGRWVAYAGEDQLLSVGREQLLRIPHKIAVASGEQKAPAILGAARADLVDVLVTDVETAEAVLAHPERS